MPDEPASPVRAWRESFGDRKLPDISRKITACVACRKQKIKCHMQGSNPPCTRCKKRGLSCTVNRSLQMLMENDVTWKHEMDRKFQRLSELVDSVASKVLSPELAHSLTQEEAAGSYNAATTLPNPAQRQDISHGSPALSSEPRVNPPAIVMDLETSPGAIPGFHLDQTPPEPLEHQDLITRGVITQDAAQLYWTTYRDRLDHFPYRILGDHGDSSSLQNIREASALLAAAVCTVGALHLNAKDFEVCLKEFLSLSALQSASVQSSIGDLRALVIGALWLSNMSGSFVASAVLIAREMHLHRSYYKARHGDKEQYLRARLYYLVYIADHQSSIPFGQPPMTRECDAVRSVRLFAQSPHATEDDSRIASQVTRWSLCSEVFDAFGANIDRPLSDAELGRIRAFAVSFDSLRTEWADRFSRNAHVGNYPNKGVVLQHHFAKLFLFSLAFRGAVQFSKEAHGENAAVSVDVSELINLAVLSSTSILQIVLHDGEVQSFLNGLPTYFTAMIAFAAVFLIKTATVFSAQAPLLNTEEARRLIQSVIDTLTAVTAPVHGRHLLVHVTKGIKSLFLRSGLSDSNALPRQNANASQVQDGTETPEAYQDTIGCDLDAIDLGFMNDFDFLGPAEFDWNFEDMNTAGC